MLKTTEKKTFSAMSLTVTHSLFARLQPITVNPFQKALDELAHMRQNAEECKASEDIDALSYDLRGVDKVCTHGLKADAFLNALMRGVRSQANAG